ncbi:DUF4179 domain-containing protein [Peribacillus frigoritolerans]|uniref:DUF4179 domain-containing protein n=1 Tax=Peribacillus frigoritolerans TaxID=450367 RepID=UPI00207955F2|nr:DUF4179 domain-containing protein [Peribacillus frigoritolerans]USK80756.1 DUF4179 domain-containing protein [Peribacillus frigoritolerans]WJE48028.1 DUF4179 domain-containing protein [Peribacillus frigoritolerans]
MNNQIPDIKEAIKKIEVPIDKLDKTIDVAIKRAKTKHKKPKRKLYPFIGVASLATCVLIGSAFVSPAMAKVLSSIPVLNSVFEFVGDRGLEIASQKGLSEKIEKTVTDKNISLTMKDIFFDGTRLSISYIQEFPNKWDDIGELELKVNGKEINFGDGRTGEFLSDNQYAGVINIEPTEELPDSFDLSIGLNNIGKVKGNWNFEIPVTKSKEEVKTIQSNQTMNYKDTKMTVKTVKIGPAGIKLSVDLTSSAGENPQMIDDSHLQFNLLNDKGESLTQSGGSGSGSDIGGEFVMNMEYRFSPLEENSEFLTISPFLIPITNEQSSRIEQPLHLNKLPITLDQGEMGKIMVTDVKYQKDKTLLYFEVVSDFPYDGHFQFNNLWLEDKAGNNLTSDSKGYPERIKQNTYVQEFKHINKNEPLIVVTIKMPNLEVLKEMEIKIPLK